MGNLKSRIKQSLCLLVVLSQLIFCTGAYATDMYSLEQNKATEINFNNRLKYAELFQCPEEISVREILPDVWMLGGYMSDDFFLKAPSSNVYVLRDGDTVYIVDPGKYTVYKKKILELVNMYKGKGVTKVGLLITQGHFDHDTNNDVVRETGLEWKFYLPEEEVPTMNAVDDFMNDINELSKYEDVYQTMFPETGFSSIFRTIGKISPSLAKEMLRLLATATMGTGNHLADEASILQTDQRITKEFGSVSLQGWELGRFFVIFDGAHSPGHICIYDPINKLILSGDTTVEVNPAFTYSSVNKLIDITGKFKAMAHEGYIKYAMDSHRSNKHMKELFQSFGFNALNSIQLIDYAQNSSECETFFGFFNTYYKEMQEEVFAAHSRIGRATVGEIVDELLKSDNEYVNFKASLAFPQVPSRMDVLVVQVLKEAKAVPIVVDDEILIDPIRR